MTPIAGEGLNIKNVREIHLLEAWYHFNRIDQIIGRGIRNCSHKFLPLTKRNVTVFMHCAIDGYKKKQQMFMLIEYHLENYINHLRLIKWLRDNSIDCSLFKDINYFPKSMFKLGNIKIRNITRSNNWKELGDEDELEPKCNVIDNSKIDSRGFRQDTYKHLALNIEMKLRELILNSIQDEKYYLSIKDIRDFFPQIDIDILMYAISLSIYPNIIIDGYIVVPHESGIHIVKVINDVPLKIDN